MRTENEIINRKTLRKTLFIKYQLVYNKAIEIREKVRSNIEIEV